MAAVLTSAANELTITAITHMNKLRKIAHPDLVILLLICLLVGTLTFRDYGQSWDELQFYKYADHAIASYALSLQSAQIIVTGNTYDNYGPAFVMFNELTAGGLPAVLPWGLISNLRHFLYFLLFFSGHFALSLPARRWLDAL